MIPFKNIYSSLVNPFKSIKTPKYTTAASPIEIRILTTPIRFNCKIANTIILEDNTLFVINFKSMSKGNLLKLRMVVIDKRIINVIKVEIAAPKIPTKGTKIIFAIMLIKAEIIVISAIVFVFLKSTKPLLIIELQFKKIVANATIETIK